MKTIKGPGLFLTQFINTDERLTSLEGLAGFAGEHGFKALQVTTANQVIFDVGRAAESQAYCDDVKGMLAKHGLVISELTANRHSHLIAVNPAFDPLVAPMAPEQVRSNPKARTEWAVQQVLAAVKASRRLGLDRLIVFSGCFLFPYFYPFPPIPEGLVRESYAELARRWQPILDACEEAGIDLCYEPHPNCDVYDGVTFERLLEAMGNHPRCNLLYDASHLFLQHIDYLGFIDVYHSRIKTFHVKDAEFNVSPRSGTFGGFQDWTQRPGRFRSPGDGSIDFKGIFARLTGYDFDGWATLEWECAFKNRYDGAREGAELIRNHIIAVTNAPFDKAMRRPVTPEDIRSILRT